MSNSKVACYDSTSLGAEIEITEGNSNNQRLVYTYPNPGSTPPFQDADIQQNEDGSDQCESGDSGEGFLTIPIYSVDTNYTPHVSKAKRECSPPTDDDGGRKRVKFLPQHIKLLEELFSDSQYPTTEVREKLEQQLGVSENRILVWFQNRRAKEKRETKRLQKVRNMRKQSDSKLQPPPFWPEDLSFDAPLRHITPSERRIKTANVLPPPTPISEVVEDAVNFMPHNIQTRVPVLTPRPITDRNPACSYQNSTNTVPLQNEIQYTAGDRSSVFPMATIKSLTLTQTSFQPYATQPQTEPMRVEMAHWEDPIYPNQSIINYPYSISNYLPVEAQFQAQPYPWFGNSTVVPNQVNAPANLCHNEQFLPANCNKIYCTPCKQNY